MQKQNCAATLALLIMIPTSERSEETISFTFTFTYMFMFLSMRGIYALQIKPRRWVAKDK